MFHVKFSDEPIFKRNLLSYNINNKKQYCSICLTVTDGSSVFCQGYDQYKYLTQTLWEHEKSDAHIKSVETNIMYKH